MSAMRALFLCACATVPAVPAVAQCPDGTPPPCRGAVAPARTANSNSIAVLYFDNLSRDSADAYIADGLTDEIIVRLQHVQRLDVKSRNEVRRLRGSGITDSRTLGRDLHVAWLVTGSVRPSASRMRVSYELVRTSDGRTMASDIVDTTAADQWAISNGVALAIARAVAGRLAPEENAALLRGGSRDAQAMDFYRRGTYLFQRGVLGNWIDRLYAQGFFSAAIERDSAFADAWAARAVDWGWLDFKFTNRTVAEWGRADARRALALDSASSMAAAALAWALFTVDYDWPGAERLLRRSIALDPRGVDSRLALSTVLDATGRLDEAVRQVEEAWALDSLNRRIDYYLMMSLFSARRYEEMRRWAEHSVISPGRRRQMRLLADRGVQRRDSAQVHSDAGVTALAAAGRRDQANRLQAADDSARAEGRTVGDADDMAAVWAAVGDRDRAFAALELSYRVTSSNLLPYIKYLPYFDSLRDDPRYHDLLRRMHLEP